MTSFLGSCRLIFHDAIWALGRVLFLYITLPLMAAWIIIGLIFDLPADVVIGISVPVYINLVIVPITGFKSLFPVAVGMGSTRVQFLKSFYITCLVVVFFTMFLLNVCQYVLVAVYEKWIGLASILHPAAFFLNDFQFFPYFWIDLMVGLFFFWASFLIYCIWYRVGTVRSLISLTIVIIAGLFLYYGGILGSWWVWVWSLNIDAMAAFTLLGAVSLAALFITYPLMRNAPLQPKPRN